MRNYVAKQSGNYKKEKGTSNGLSLFLFAIKIAQLDFV